MKLSYARKPTYDSKLEFHFSDLKDDIYKNMNDIHEIFELFIDEKCYDIGDVGDHIKLCNNIKMIQYIINRLHNDMKSNYESHVLCFYQHNDGSIEINNNCVKDTLKLIYDNLYVIYILYAMVINNIIESDNTDIKFEKIGTSSDGSGGIFITTRDGSGNRIKKYDLGLIKLNEDNENLDINKLFDSLSEYYSNNNINGIKDLVKSLSNNVNNIISDKIETNTNNLELN